MEGLVHPRPPVDPCLAGAPPRHDCLDRKPIFASFHPSPRLWSNRLHRARSVRSLHPCRPAGVLSSPELRQVPLHRARRRPPLLLCRRPPASSASCMSEENAPVDRARPCLDPVGSAGAIHPAPEWAGLPAPEAQMRALPAYPSSSNGPKPMGEATPSAPSFFFLLLGQFSFGPVDVFFGSANLANFQGFAYLQKTP